MFLWYTLVYASGETLLWIYRRLIGRPYIALARAGQRILQYIGCTREAQDKTTILMYIPTPLGAFHLEIHPWLPWYLVVVPGESLNIQPLYHISSVQTIHLMICIQWRVLQRWLTRNPDSSLGVSMCPRWPQSFNKSTPPSM